MNEYDFKKVVGEITIMFRTSFEPIKVSRYWEYLKKEDFNLVWVNLQNHIKTEKFEPTISELIKPLPKLSYHDHLKNDARKFLTSPMVTEKKGEPAPGYIKDYMNKRRAELKNKREKGE